MMDEDDERNALRQVLKERCSNDMKFRDDDINKLVDAGFTSASALAEATMERLDAVLPWRPGVVGLLLKAFVQPAGMFPSQGFPVMMLIFGAVTMGG